MTIIAKYKFNSSIDIGVKELQQMFDYLED